MKGNKGESERRTEEEVVRRGGDSAELYMHVPYTFTEKYIFDK
jgi:hypothetical protein